MASVKVLLVLGVIVAAAIADEKYTSKYDNIDLDEILANDKLLESYVNCVLGKAKCTPEGNELKDHLEDALQTGCKKCTEEQKKGTKKVINHLIKEKLALWRELCAKFDPSGEYRKQYEAQAKEAGIEIPPE